MSDSRFEHFIASDGTPMVHIYRYNYEAGEEDYVESIPEHWFPHEEEYFTDDEDDEY